MLVVGNKKNYTACNKRKLFDDTHEVIKGMVIC